MSHLLYKECGRWTRFSYISTLQCQSFINGCGFEEVAAIWIMVFPVVSPRWWRVGWSGGRKGGLYVSWLGTGCDSSLSNGAVRVCLSTQESATAKRGFTCVNAPAPFSSLTHTHTHTLVVPLGEEQRITKSESKSTKLTPIEPLSRAVSEYCEYYYGLWKRKRSKNNCK